MYRYTLLYIELEITVCRNLLFLILLVQKWSLFLIGEAGVGGEPVDPEELLLPQRKKTTSFKITNVFLSRPPSNDGDESNEDCEDMEDSHTEVGGLIQSW